MGPKPGAEEDEPELFLLPLAHSRTHLTTVLFWGEIWVHEDDPTHHVHPSMLCHAQPPGLVVITCLLPGLSFGLMLTLLVPSGL